MEQYLLSLTSAFVGAIIGASVAIWINRANHRVAATEKMLALVYPIGFKSWWKTEEGKPALIFHENYSELWGAYAALRAALPWWKRKKLDKARNSQVKRRSGRKEWRVRPLPYWITLTSVSSRRVRRCPLRLRLMLIVRSAQHGQQGVWRACSKLSPPRSQEEVVERSRLLKQVVNEAAGEKIPEA